MKIIRTIPAMRDYACRVRWASRTIGLVPTMGALHQGHLSLITAARRATDVVVVSSFVNPLQFGPGEDFHRYPRTVNKDIECCADAGVDVLFLPSTKAMYPSGFQTSVVVRELTRRFEGQSRPTHFEGVATVVTKLCHIVTPDQMFFGQKDYQQALVIKRLLVDLNLDIKLVVKPTIRAPDGLAVSSRNNLLKPEERRAASVIYRALKKGAATILAGEHSAARIRRVVQRTLDSEPLVKMDYIAIMHPDTLEEVVRITRRVVIAIAARIGGTRLIDNVIVRAR